MENRIRIALFEWTPRSPMAWVILFGTGCIFSHVAIEVNGVWYDASETRGTFAEADVISLAGRPCQLAEIRGDASLWLKRMHGKHYDYRGVAGWIACRLFNAGCGSNHRFYCFEAANDLLKSLGLRGVKRRAVSGCDIRSALPVNTRFWKFGESSNG